MFIYINFEFEIKFDTYINDFHIYTILKITGVNKIKIYEKLEGNDYLKIKNKEKINKFKYS